MLPLSYIGMLKWACNFQFTLLESQETWGKVELNLESASWSLVPVSLPPRNLMIREESNADEEWGMEGDPPRKRLRDSPPHFPTLRIRGEVRERSSGWGRIELDSGVGERLNTNRPGSLLLPFGTFNYLMQFLQFFAQYQILLSN